MGSFEDEVRKIIEETVRIAWQMPNTPYGAKLRHSYRSLEEAIEGEYRRQKRAFIEVKGW